jgi:LPXTG-motif cell wall-anchored protein
MSRSVTSRLAAVGGLTLAVAVPGLAFAPTASAAPLPALQVSADEVKPNETFTVAGEDCLPSSGAGHTPIVAVTTDEETSDILLVEPESDGSWAVEMAFLTDAAVGEHEIWATCSTEYNGTYQDANETVYPIATIDVAQIGEVRGVAANTPGTKSVSTDKTTGNSSTPGEKVVKVIAGFQPGEVVVLVMHSTPVVLGTFTADANGVVTAEFTLAAGTAVGTHTLVYEGNLGTYFQESFTVTPAGKQLAYTGADVTVPLTVGLGLLAAGAGALVVSRRRTAGAPQA